MNSITQFFIAIAMLCVLNDSNATIITLEGNDIRTTGIYIEGGFKITAPVDLVNGGNLVERSHLNAIGFSGDYMETWNTEAIFNLEELAGKSFNLIGLDVGSYHITNGGLASWTFKGFSGDVEMFSLLNSELLGFQLLNWNNLTRLSIQSSRSSAASSFDNIKIAIPPINERITTVDEAQTSLFFALGLIGLGWRFKSKNTP